jgi:GNAT superfamily N-acetyltransferase
MMEALEARARARRIPLLRLDTNSGLPEALALYRKLGWTPVDRYNENWDADTFFEKRL